MADYGRRPARGRAWLAALVAVTCGVIIAACGSDIDAAKDAFRGVMAARAEGELLRDTQQGIETTHRLVCDATAHFQRADFELRRDPFDEDLRFLHSDLYSENIARLGLDALEWCLERGYIDQHALAGY